MAVAAQPARSRNIPGPKFSSASKRKSDGLHFGARSSRQSNDRERAFLVGVEFRGGRRRVLQQANLARNAAAWSPPGAEGDTSDEQVTPNIESGLTAPVVAEPTGKASSGFSMEESMAEFRDLAISAGAEIAGETVQKRDKPDPATLIGAGKLQEIVGAALSSHADLILFDHDLSASQQRNIEREVNLRVIDRTQLILDIFARHARTREGQLQVELAQLEYLLPRLSGRGVEMSQLGGGIGTRGPGETQLETDRRKIYRRVRHVKEQLEEVRRIRAQQRQRRQSVPLPTVALVGYTNAGKSTLFNALTNAGVETSSRMFATLDPTIRAVTLPSKRTVLLSDTVGFIRNLPHTLVTSFRATLEEVQRAALILQVSDVSSPAAAEQRAQVEKVLAELEVQDKPRLRVLNKIDLLSPRQAESLRDSAETVHISVIKQVGLATLLEKIDASIADDPVVTLRLKVPQSEGKVLASLEANSQILSRRFRGGNVYLNVQAPESRARTWRKFFAD